MNLESLGFGEPFRTAFATESDPSCVPARVFSAQREQFELCSEAGSLTASLSGRLRHEATQGGLPVVGDWVVARPDSSGERASILRVLPRKTSLTRKRPERSSELQLMAANVDYVFVVSALNQDFSPRRIERALALIWEGGAQPVVLLTKLDSCPDPEAYLESAREVALGVPVHALSVHSGMGLEALDAYLTPARTVALIGSSGVGKSTLVNHCLGETRAATQAARDGDDKGRHTTTARELFLLPQGALLIDTPGMRELGLVEASDGLDATFADIEALSTGCRFSDCQHRADPGCAIQAALQRGELDPARLAAYGKLQRELAYEHRRHDARARQDHQRDLRKLFKERNRAQRAHPKR
ncbi:MAG TPA: ribosome small subunit-dependent GTPase A [Polyangiales bacterium]|nr:ribosome small subunit-dependent GTPase A [Polyangiales bacterium]